MSYDLQKRADSVIANTYARYPVSFTEGRGTRLKDDKGKEYIDFVSGIAVCSLGHSHPAVEKAVLNQAGLLLHVSNLFYTKPQVKLAEMLVKKSFADKVFFCNSGAEANEAAIKLARRYAHKHKGPDCKHIITMERSFHGRTMATLTATGQDKIKEGFSPLLPGFSHVPYGDFKALEGAIDENVCAVMLELVQGEGGLRLIDPSYLKEVADLCRSKDILLIFDEIQTGMGRTGKLFAYEHFDILPDIMTLAKALANGLPIGAMLAKDKLMDSFSPGSHASTFGGGPLVCEAASAVLETLEKDGLIERCAELGLYFKEKLETLKKHSFVKEARGLGLLLGLELSCEGAPIVRAMLEKGFIINCVQGNILRFVPPFIIEKSEIDSLVLALDELFFEMEK